MLEKNILSIQPLGFPWETRDPFLFCVHHADDYPKGKEDLTPDASLSGRNIGQDFTIKDGWRMYHGDSIPGFPFHPHRGFETVTITTKGLIDHADSLGASGRFGNGDVQWMTAGKGVQHSEMFPMLNKETGNPLEFFQLWLNLPKSKKFANPNFAMIWADKVPIVDEQDENGINTEVRIVSGVYKDQSAPSVSPDSWAADPDNEVAIWVITIGANGKWKLPPASKNVHRTLYYYKGGSCDIDGVSISLNHSAHVRPDANLTLTAGNKEVQLLMLQGKPIKEPVAQYGPFVMNSDAEIQQAYADYRKTQFGGWPWPRRDQVHDRSKGRFARYADGTLEEK